MKCVIGLFGFSMLFVFSACGGGTSVPPAQNLNSSGNWQFSMTSSASGPPITIAANLTQTGTSVAGAAHLQGLNCFSPLTTIGLSGSLTGADLSLTSASVSGQVITLGGTISNKSLTGSYSISGGCANGDSGTVKGFHVPTIQGRWRVIFDVNGAHNGGIADLTQESSSSGSFPVSGTTDDSSGLACLSGTIAPGAFPAPSFIMGTAVALKVNTSDGTINFDGAVNETSGEILGTYTISGGSCSSVIDIGFACFGRSLQSSCQLPF